MSRLPKLRVFDEAGHPCRRRYLVNERGAPFFYLGDTAWELFHRLTREEAEQYLQDRASKGFTVIQAVALAELDGLRTRTVQAHWYDPRTGQSQPIGEFRNTGEREFQPRTQSDEDWVLVLESV